MIQSGGDLAVTSLPAARPFSYYGNEVVNMNLQQQAAVGLHEMLHMAHPSRTNARVIDFPLPSFGSLGTLWVFRDCGLDQRIQ
jgi:hypothetical protein